MTGIWINKFEVVMRPLRERHGAQTTILLETRTAAQASREATTRFPGMKVVSVTRMSPTVASIKAAQSAQAPHQPGPSTSDDTASPQDAALATVHSLRRTGSR